MKYSCGRRQQGSKAHRVTEIKTVCLGAGIDKSTKNWERAAQQTHTSVDTWSVVGVVLHICVEIIDFSINCAVKTGYPYWEKERKIFQLCTIYKNKFLLVD